MRKFCERLCQLCHGTMNRFEIRTPHTIYVYKYKCLFTIFNVTMYSSTFLTKRNDTYSESRTTDDYDRINHGSEVLDSRVVDVCVYHAWGLGSIPLWDIVPIFLLLLLNLIFIF